MALFCIVIMLFVNNNFFFFFFFVSTDPVTHFILCDSSVVRGVICLCWFGQSCLHCDNAICEQQFFSFFFVSGSSHFILCDSSVKRSDLLDVGLARPVTLVLYCFVIMLFVNSDFYFFSSLCERFPSLHFVCLQWC